MGSEWAHRSGSCVTSERFEHQSAPWVFYSGQLSVMLSGTSVIHANEKDR
jgi:hypothetical protein